MNKKIPFPFFYNLLFLLFCSAGFSQTPGTLWAHNVGTEGKSIAADADGNVYTTGYYQGTHDFDQGPDSLKYTSFNSNADIFIQKLDASGNLVWANVLGGKSVDVGNAIAVDAAGNVYVAGSFYDTLDADPGTNILQFISKGGKDILVQKYDASGNLLWANQFGETGDDEAYGLALDASGNVYVTGGYIGTVDFDPGAGVANLVPNGSGDVFIVKLTTAGAYSWAKTVGGNYGGSSITDAGTAIALDGTGNVYVTGYFLGAGDFNPGAATTTLTSAGNRDIFVLKLSSAGVYVWAKRVGAANYEESTAIAIDASSNVLVTGYFIGTVDFDPGAATANLTSQQTNYEDAFVLKLTSAGNYSWARRSGNTGQGLDCGMGIASDASGNIYVTGEYGSTYIYTDVYIQKWDAAGTQQWNVNIATNSSVSRGCAIAFKNSNIHLTGYFDNFSGVDDFHPGTYNIPLSSSNGKGFVVKMKECSVVTNVVVASFCTGSTYTFGNQSLSQIGSYTGNFISTMGCDSTVTLHLVIENPLPIVGAGASVDSACGGQLVTFTGSGATTYAWSDGITDGVPYIVNGTQTYTVTGTDTNNCSATATVDVLVVAPAVQEICVVTVDSALADHNVIIWEKPMDLSGIDSFYVYREITLNNYQRVGSVHRDSLSEFQDFGANPNSTNYKYKVATIDTCGNESVMGLFHNTIHLQYFGSGNFQWTNYSIEGLPNPVASYNFYRDDNSTGNFQLQQIIPGGNNSYTDVNYGSYPNASYRVDVNWAVAHFCTPTRGAINTSRSNVKSPTSTVGLQAVFTGASVMIYPQPANEFITIEFNGVKENIHTILFDKLGRQIAEKTSDNTSSVHINTEGIAEGMYLLKIVSGKDVISKRIVIAK